MIAVHDTVLIPHHACLGDGCSCRISIKSAYKRFHICRISDNGFEQDVATLAWAKLFIDKVGLTDVYIYDTLTSEVH